VTSSSGDNDEKFGSTTMGFSGENPGGICVEKISDIGFGEYPSLMAFAENQVPGGKYGISARHSCNTGKTKTKYVSNEQ
jgi:hypothetical protein